jgi:hypothetical protein
LNGASGIRELGPFVEATNLKARLHEMVLRLGPSAVMYANQFPTADKNLERYFREFGTQLILGFKQDRAPPSSAPPEWQLGAARSRNASVGPLGTSGRAPVIRLLFVVQMPDPGDERAVPVLFSPIDGLMLGPACVQDVVGVVLDDIIVDGIALRPPLWPGLNVNIGHFARPLS